MGAMTEDRKAFEAAAKEHMETIGDKDWKLLHEKFPDINIGTKWRWLRIVRANLNKDIPLPSLMSNARDRLVASVRKIPISDRMEVFAAENLDPGARDIGLDLPAAPSPAYIAKTGDEGLHTIDFVAEIKSLYADAKMLRAYSVSKKDDPETGEKVEYIKNPAAFDKSIVRRADLLDSAIRAVQEVWDLQTMQRFYEAVIEEIGQESPACQQRIMKRLAALNSRTGMTMHMARV